MKTAKNATFNADEMRRNASSIANRMYDLLCETSLFGYSPKEDRSGQLKELTDGIMGYAIIPVLVEQFDDMASDNRAIAPTWKGIKSDLLAFADSAAM